MGKQLDGCAYCESSDEPDRLVLCCRVHVRLVCPACLQSTSYKVEHPEAA